MQTCAYRLRSLWLSAKCVYVQIRTYIYIWQHFWIYVANPRTSSVSRFDCKRQVLFPVGKVDVVLTFRLQCAYGACGYMCGRTTAQHTSLTMIHAKQVKWHETWMSRWRRRICVWRGEVIARPLEWRDRTFESALNALAYLVVDLDLWGRRWGPTGSSFQFSEIFLNVSLFVRCGQSVSQSDVWFGDIAGVVEEDLLYILHLDGSWRYTNISIVGNFYLFCKWLIL